MMMRSIKELYPLALAEGEGVGTAYEYFAKRLVLKRWLAGKQIKQMLIAGLPEKYGSSLDFFLLATELGAELTVVDDRPEAIAKAKQSVAAWGVAIDPTYELVEHWERPLVDGKRFDLILCSEVWQRLEGDLLAQVWEQWGKQTDHRALFAPNADNRAHTDISGLSGLNLAQLLPFGGRSGYIDMPPFPPGITRTEDQREHAESGLFEAFAMWGLGIYARMEHILPTTIRRSQSHIVYLVH